MKKKMSSSKKILISSILVAMLLIGAIVSVIAVLAAQSQNVSSQVNVSYVVDGVAAKVKATYATVPDSGTPVKVAMDGGTDGEHEFEVSDDELTATLDQGEQNIILSSTESQIVYEYKFTNMADAAFTINLTDYPASPTNMIVGYKISSKEIAAKDYITTDFSLSEILPQAMVEKDREMYIYISVMVDNLNSAADYSGTIEWTLLHIAESNLRTITLDDGTNQTSQKIIPNVQMPLVYELPISYDGIFTGFYDLNDDTDASNDVKYINNDGTSAHVADLAEGAVLTAKSEVTTTVVSVASVEEFETAAASADSLEQIVISEDITLTESNISIPSNARVVVKEGTTLTVEEGATLTVEGTLYNNGEIDVYGAGLAADDVQGDGTITATVDNGEDFVAVAPYSDTINVVGDCVVTESVDLTDTEVIVAEGVILSTDATQTYSEDTTNKLYVYENLTDPVASLSSGNISGSTTASLAYADSVYPVVNGNLWIYASGEKIVLSNLTIYGNIHLVATEDYDTINLELNNVEVLGVRELMKNRYLSDTHAKAYVSNAAGITIHEGVKANIEIVGSVSVTGWYNAAGIGIDADASLDLSGTGSLTTIGNNGVDQISTTSTDLDLNDREIYNVVVWVNTQYLASTGYQGGSGIGGIFSYAQNVTVIPTGDIYIHDLSSLTAKGYGYSANGIGGTMFDKDKNSNEFTIKNTTIDEARGGWYGATDTDRNLKNVKIGGAAIGTTVYANENNVFVNAAQKVTLENVVINSALGGGKSAGIGAGIYAGVDLIINNSEIYNVEGGMSAAGIGGGRVDSYELTDVTDDNRETLYEQAKTRYLAPIKITINNSTVVGVQGGAYGAGIGSGYDTYNHELAPVVDGSIIFGIGQEVVINIKGASVIANITGGDNGAGIGLGFNGSNLSGTIESTVTLYEDTILGGNAYKIKYEFGTKFMDGGRVDSIGFGNHQVHRTGIVKDSSSIIYRDNTSAYTAVKVNSTNWNYIELVSGETLHRSSNATFSIFVLEKVIREFLMYNEKEDTAFHNTTITVEMGDTTYTVNLTNAVEDGQVSAEDMIALVQTYIEENVTDVLNPSAITNNGNMVSGEYSAA